ncbi:hypothetical protein HIM_08969 [Hirsutella minnesotensis 3608]|uniref:AB hydrolase-1 domain-containing protein n=1 Tax=Hirsutella minnesotensis 3608 TaxID=1043627 RepID=A0A0F7ZY10_9HYPO|nr:hypothetical protein HIM_08969 [Hirsutella minnesotensis 3608]
MAQTARFTITEHKVAACHVREYAGSTAHQQEDVLYMSVKSYKPKRAISPKERTAVTIVAAHGVGFPKELYEPLWDDLYDCAVSRGVAIRGIWIADAVNQGSSGILNETKLSNDYSWMDHARDLLLMINEFRDEMPRPLIGVGHSFGGCQIANLALMHPRLFTSLILLDPVIQLSPPAMGFDGIPGGVNFTTHRKDLWPNRAAAAAAFQKSVSKGWDSRVVDRMIRYGYRDLPTALHPDLPADADPSDPPVTLTTTKHQDAVSQLRANFESRQPDGRIHINRSSHADMDPLAAFVPLYRPEPRSTFHRLPELRPSTLWPLGEKTYLSLDEMREGVKITGTGIGGSGGIPQGNVKEDMLRGQGHLFPFTAVGEAARICAEWISDRMVIFEEQEKAWNAERAAMTARDHLMVNQTWLDVVKPMSAFKNRL